MWVMSPCFNPKAHMKFIIRGFGLAFPRPGPALLSCLPCKPGISCKGGKKNPEVAGDGRGGCGKDLGSDGKNKGVGFGKRDRLMECCFCPRRGLAAGYPESRKGQGSMLSVQCTEQPSALLALKTGNGRAPFIFASYSSAAVPARTVPAQLYPCGTDQSRESPMLGLLTLPALQQLLHKVQTLDFLSFFF